MSVPAQLSAAEARWSAISAQGLATPRPAGRRRSASALRQLMDQVGTIQLDAVNIVARTQYLVVFSRIGAFDVEAFQQLSRPGGGWFEYWGHAASLLPYELHPLLRWRMERLREDRNDSPVVRERRRAWRAAHASYLAEVLAEVTERGPLAASQLSEPRRRTGSWWDRRSDGRRALEMLFDGGVLAAWRSSAFERVYDLTERVIPAEVLALPTPPEDEAQRQLLELAARHSGVATLADLAAYFGLRVPVARARLAELIEDGRLIEVGVEGWASPGYALPGLRPHRPHRRHATALSPFDSLIWTRERTERLFGFHYRLEIYVPAERRMHGYYVLPLLLGDKLVGRVDLKADRKTSELRVIAAHAEPGQDRAEVAEAVAVELAAMRDWLRLASVSLSGRGELAPLLGGYLAGNGSSG